MKLVASKLAAGATKTAVLQDVNLEMNSGQTLVILGPNGSGKSTLLKTLARQLPPLGGNVSIDGLDIWQMPPPAFARQVAFVPQSTDSAIQLSIQEYVGLGRSPHQKWWQWQQTEVDKAAVESALEATALVPLRHRPLANLSGGEQQRAAIAIALAQKPSFLLLDEPTAHLDFKHQCELLQLLKRLKLEQSLGLVIVLHDLSAAAQLADEVLLLKHGADGQSAIAALGAADQILDEKKLEEAFEVVFTSTKHDGKNHYFVNFEKDTQRS